MIYIISIGTSTLLSLFILIYMVKVGYFSMEKCGSESFEEQKVGLTNNKNRYETEDVVNNFDENKCRVKFIPYTKKQSIILLVLFFTISAAVHTILYLYTVKSENAPGIFLFVKLVIMNGLLACAALTDYKSKIIPNTFIMIGVISRIIIYVLEFIFKRNTFIVTLKNDIVGFIIGFVVLFIVAVATKGGIGYGDVKLFGLLGVMIGSGGVFTTLFVSLVINSITALLLIAFKKKTFKSSLPMAPFIYVGYIIICILGLF